MISSSYESDAKKFISDLRKIKNAPRYAVGFEHTIKAIEYAVDVVSGRIERSRLIIQSLENSLNDILYRQSEEKYLWMQPTRLPRPWESLQARVLEWVASAFSGIWAITC